MSNKKVTPLQRLPRYAAILLSQITVNREYAYFWLLSTILFIAHFRLAHPLGWFASALFSLLIGLAGISSKVWPVEKAFETIGLNFDTGYGTPKWILEGKYPLVSDVIRINAAGYTAADFEKYSDHLATRLRSAIKEIRKPLVSVPVIEVVLKKSTIPKRLPFSELPLNELGQGEFYIGRNDDQLVRQKLSKMPHMLVAGQTGSGKTQFLRQFIATVLTHTRHSHICLIDIKGGIDFQSFLGISNFEIVTNHDDAHTLLNHAITLYEIRRDYLLKKKKTNWADLPLKDLVNEEALKGKPVGPVVIVVDELAELSKKATQAAAKSTLQEQLATIARLARFTGIHLVLGTQRPDKSTIDMQSKDNLPTRICFSVPSVAASTLVLGDMSASTLGSHPGKAVYQHQGSQIVQTPLIENAEIEHLVSALGERLKHSNYDRNVGAVVKFDTLPETVGEF